MYVPPCLYVCMFMCLCVCEYVFCMEERIRYEVSVTNSVVGGSVTWYEYKSPRSSNDGQWDVIPKKKNGKWHNTFRITIIYGVRTFSLHKRRKNWSWKENKKGIKKKVGKWVQCIDLSRSSEGVGIECIV